MLATAMQRGVVPAKKQVGFSLVELLISSAIGLIVLAGVINIYVTTVDNSNKQMQLTQLTEEMRVVMGVMATDIRHAGYWNHATDVLWAGASVSNPFQQGGDALSILQCNATRTTNCPCINFSYDDTQALVTNNTVDAGERHAYFYDGTAIRMYRGGYTGTTFNSCDASGGGSWERVTDPNALQVTAVSLVEDPLHQQCWNVSNIPPTPCVPTDAATDIRLNMRTVQISMTAALTNDPAITRHMMTSVKIRNDQTL